MKKTLSILTALSLLIMMLSLAAVPVSAAAHIEPVLENGVYYSSSVKRSNDVFAYQNPQYCEYLCANGLPITINARPDGLDGARVSWTYEGTDYFKDIGKVSIVAGGGWDTPVASTSVVMRGGDVNYGVFGGGVKAGADVGTAENPGTVFVIVTGGYSYDGIVGGGIMADVYGDITVNIGGTADITSNVIGGGFFGDVHGNISVEFSGANIGHGVDMGFTCGGGVMGDVYGNINVLISGGDVNGDVCGGSMGSGKVTGDIVVKMTGGQVMDVAGGGVNFAGTGEINGNTKVIIEGGVVEDIVAGGDMAIYSSGTITGNTAVVITGGEIGKDADDGHSRNIYGGSVGGDVVGEAAVIISGGTIVNDVVAGADDGNVSGNVSVVIAAGEIKGDVIVGCNSGGNVATDEEASIAVLVTSDAQVVGEINNGTTPPEVFNPETEVLNEDSQVSNEWVLEVVNTTIQGTGGETPVIPVIADECGIHGHIWSDWTVVKEPTYSTPGSKTRSCTREGCDETETVEIPALGYDTLFDRIIEFFDKLKAMFDSFFAIFA